MANDAMPATSANFGSAAIAANLSQPGADTSAPATSTAIAPASSRANAPTPTNSRENGDAQFGGDTPDVPFDDAQEPLPPEDGLEASPDVPPDDFVEAEPVDLDEVVHGMKMRDIIAAIKNGGLPPEVASAMQIAAPELDEVIHGVPARDYLALIKSGGTVQQAEMLEALKGTATIDGRPLEVSFREALNGYQRLSDTTRKNKAIAAHKQELDARDATFVDMVKQWQADPATARAGAKRFGFLGTLEKALFDGFEDPGKLRQTLTRRGYGEALLKVTESIVEEEIELSKIARNADGTPNPHGIALVQRMRAEKKMREDMDRDLWTKEQQIQDANERERARQNQQQRRQQPQGGGNQEMQQRIFQGMSEGFEAAGMKKMKNAQGVERFPDYYQNVFADDFAVRIADHQGQLTEQALQRLIADSVKATQEFIGDEAAAARGGAAPAPVARALPAAAPAAPAAAPAAPVAAAPARAPQPNPSPLSPRPGATPTAPASSAPLQRGGSSEDFQSYMAELKRRGRG